MASANVIILTDENFEQEVVKSNIPVLVDFWAPWCGPCQRIAPLLDEIATEYAGKTKVGKVNVDENPRTATEFRVQSIPMLYVFKGGQPVERLIGAVPKTNITSAIDKHLSDK